MDEPSLPHPVSLREATRVWLRIGLLGFGGPAAQIALMHRELVEKRRWISEERFLHALNYCTLLPGPEAQQLATYVGWLLHGLRGGLVAGGLFILPGALVILGLSVLYTGFSSIAAVGALFYGLKAAVLAVVVEAVLRIGKRAIQGRLTIALAALAFVAIFFFGAPFPLIVLGAGVFGAAFHRLFPAAAEAKKGGSPKDEAVIDGLLAQGGLRHTRPSAARALAVLALGLLLWAAPVGLAALVAGPESAYLDIGVFFSKAAVVTFGGAYAVLAYVAQEAVTRYAWLGPAQMLDGLGLAETTPGPLILVLQFVGFVGAYNHPGALPPLLAGTLGAAMALWVTFVPCFIWIFLGAPYVERVRSVRPLRTALSAITAAVVGVILNLSVWFALHVVFRVVEERTFGPVQLHVPELATLDVPSALIALGAMIAMFRFHVGMGRVLAAAALVGAVVRLALGT